MNERIQELAEQAKLYDGWFCGEGNIEKFECLDQCYNRGMNDELYAGQLKAAAYIEEHFGVE
ncbi:MAG: hypothetical protein EBT86_12050 [Actinobacteria bacterium]|nr:hypothetical protein [Actinomycetota bacterium]